MDRRNFLKKSAIGIGAAAVTGLALGEIIYAKTEKNMKKIVIMDGTPERNNSNGFGSMEYCITAALGEPQRLTAYNTCQVANYGNYELAGFSEEAKQQWRDEHWEEDLQKAFEAGKKILTNGKH